MDQAELDHLLNMPSSVTGCSRYAAKFYARHFVGHMN